MNSLWILVDEFRRPLGLAAFIAPFVGPLLGPLFTLTVRPRSTTAEWDRAQRRRMRAGCLTGAVMTPALFYLGFCSPPPGEGIAARDGKAYAEPLVTALADFQRRTGAFPDSLAELSLATVAGSPSGPGGKWHWSHYSYHRDSTGGYELGFQYFGPGVNDCTLVPKDHRWRCGGYF